MKFTLHSVTFALFCLLGLATVSAPAQSPLPATETLTVGALTSQLPGQSQAWAYLFWQTDAPDLVNSRSYSIWQKPGIASAPGEYTRVGIVKLQSDPAAVGAIIERSRLALGEDLEQLDDVVSELFESLVPTLTDVPAPQRLAAKVSAVLRGVAADSRKVRSLALAARYQPSIAMAVGQAFSVKIPSSGPVTFELREYLPATQTDDAVLSRVTVDHAAPVQLPVPSVVYQIPDLAQAGFNHLNLKLVWDTPDELRRLLPLTRGANVYRVKRATAEANNWHSVPPDSLTLAAQSTALASNVGRVNITPILPIKLLNAAETVVAKAGDQFVVDDAMRMPGFPAIAARPKNGDQYYYFVTTSDILGHENKGKSSPGLLATFCDRLMPDTPTGLKVTNDYTYNNGSPNQLLRLTWKANDNSGAKKTKGYLVYRWSTADGPVKPTGSPPMPISLDPTAHLIAGPIPHVDGKATFTYLDNGPGSPSPPADWNQTFWYTVRAVDDCDVSRPPGGVVTPASPYGGNLSPNSPSAYGALRDRVGPAAPTGTVKILCALPGIAAGTVVRSNDNTLSPSLRFVQLIASRPVAEENIEAVDFEQQTGATWTSLGRVHFTTGATSLTRYLEFVPGSLGAPITVRARAVNDIGDTSSFVPITFTEPPALSLLQVNWATSISYSRMPVSPRCQQHTPPPPGSGVTPVDGNDVTVEFLPPPGTRQFKLYYRIDDSPLTLAKEDSQNFDGNVLHKVLVGLLPAVTSEICLFLQVFDLDGNPSPMKMVGCYVVKGTSPLAKPMLAPISSSGTQAIPVAQFQWFCPPAGVDKFEVWISASPSGLPQSLAGNLNQDPTHPTGSLIEEISGGVFANVTYQIYNSEHVGPLFGSGSTFALAAGVASGQKIRVKVRAVTETGQAGPFSNVEVYQWSPPPAFSGPDVPWPARSLPAIGGLGPFSAPVAPNYFPAEGFVGISIGAFSGSATPVNYQGRVVMQIPAASPPETWLLTAKFTNPDSVRNPLPCLLYRTQIPDLPSLPGKPLANYPTTPGDVVQVSPLMESIAYVTEPANGGGTGNTIYDPFLHVVSVTLDNKSFGAIYLKDTTPVISGARYQYLLVLLDPATHEISHVLPLPVIDIP